MEKVNQVLSYASEYAEYIWDKIKMVGNAIKDFAVQAYNTVKDGVVKVC